MGMFDTILVKASLMEHIINPDYLSSFKESCLHENGYYSFQTKDLDNFLNTYYFEDDRKVYLRRYSYSEEEFDSNVTFERVTAYVHFYDSFQTETHHIFYTFKAHLVEGEIKSINVHCIEQDCLFEMNEKAEEHKRKYAFMESTWEMKLFRLLQYIEYNRFGYSIRRKYENFKTYLRESAEKKSEL
jgi:hypothetical protein